MTEDRAYNKTLIACLIAYVAQAIVNNFVPLLFLTFQDSYGIPLSRITLLITVNFLLQLMIDFLSVYFINKLGYRRSMIIAHIFIVVGLVLLTVLPDILPPFAGLLISVMIYGVGGGLLEVLVSPVTEACPTKNKEKIMSLLHSFYCWGQVGVVLVSTVFFALFGTSNWRIMAVIWSLLPLFNIILFARVPIGSLTEEGDEGMSLKELLKTKLFLLFLLMMLCSGAGEQAVSQWASTFAEKALGITKTLGDLLGPMSFAILMGTSRTFYGVFGDKINLNKFMFLSCVFLTASYLGIFFAPNQMVSLLCCAFCGLFVGILWPGTFSLSSAALRRGGTSMFALLALAGDLGCMSGPTLVGFVSDLFDENLRIGILSAIIFPVLLLVSIAVLGKSKKTTV